MRRTDHRTEGSRMEPGRDDHLDHTDHTDHTDDHAGHVRRPGRVHRETAREAGLGPISALSIAAGTMCAYGAFAIIAAVTGALLSNTDLETDFRTDDWTSTGAAAGLATALVLLAAYVFGGYVAGRMARRSGIVHGIGVFLVSLAVGLLVGGVASLADGVDVAENLRSIGVPTEWDQIESVGAAAAIASIVAMLLGSLVGGMLGERWHTKLANRFEDPAYGPAAEARARAEREDRAHAERRDADHLVRHDAALLDQDRSHTDDSDHSDRSDSDHSDSDRSDEAERPEHRDAGTLDRSAPPIGDRRVETIDLGPPPPPPPPPPPLTVTLTDRAPVDQDDAGRDPSPGHRSR